MELEIKKQAWALALAVMCGAGLGLVYDMLRPFRYRAGKTFQVLLDALFALLAFAAAFLYGQFTYKGRLGLWEILGLALGFGLYMQTASSLFLRIINCWIALFSAFLGRIKELLKKSRDFLKFYFQKEQ